MPDHNISQCELIGAILKHLDKKEGVKEMLPREINAVISAADLIVDALAKPEGKSYPGMGLKEWMQSDDTGMSSVFMAATLSGFSRPYAHPHDPSDLGRCIRLLDAVPELRERLDKMKTTGKEWAALVDNWEELTELYHQEFPSGSAPKTYAFMQQLIHFLA